MPSGAAFSGGNCDGQDGKTRDEMVTAVGKVLGAVPSPARTTRDTEAAEHKHEGPGDEEDDSAESLWVLRRQGDMIYMVIRPPGACSHVFILKSELGRL